MFEFFRIWLLVVTAAMAVAGVVAVLIVGTPLFSRVGAFFDRAFWPGRSDTITRNFQSWAYRVTIATMAGWGTGLAIVIANAFSSREAWVRWSITASIAVSFPLDTGRSLLHKVYANAALIVALLVLLAIPLIGTFGEFH